MAGNPAKTIDFMIVLIELTHKNKKHDQYYRKQSLFLRVFVLW